jgi:hypothetical protein
VQPFDGNTRIEGNMTDVSDQGDLNMDEDNLYTASGDDEETDPHEQARSWSMAIQILSFERLAFLFETIGLPPQVHQKPLPLIQLAQEYIIKLWSGHHHPEQDKAHFFAGITQHYGAAIATQVERWCQRYMVQRRSDLQLFDWLGVVLYLSRDSIEEVLQAMPDWQTIVIDLIQTFDEPRYIQQANEVDRLLETVDTTVETEWEQWIWTKSWNSIGEEWESSFTPPLEAAMDCYSVISANFYIFEVIQRWRTKLSPQEEIEFPICLTQFANERDYCFSSDTLSLQNL